jgi:hypothetical protein
MYTQDDLDAAFILGVRAASSEEFEPIMDEETGRLYWSKDPWKDYSAYFKKRRQKLEDKAELKRIKALPEAEYKLARRAFNVKRALRDG